MNTTGVRANVLALKEPWAFTWDTLESARFEVYGVVARRGPDGIPLFNFSQTVWLQRGMQMNWSKRLSCGVQTLAVNILTRCLAGPKVSTYVVFSTQKAIDNALRFAEECVLTMPEAGGGRIPLDFMAKWIRHAVLALHAPTRCGRNSREAACAKGDRIMQPFLGD